MKYVNIGVLAHVDAGKTSLTERLLFNAGVIDRIGKVDSGSTQTDSLDVERQRGITIQSGVVSFSVGEVQINLIDTPGHSDFVAEVERALRVLDGAILVISAVEGVQARTKILVRTLMRLQIPTLIFVNKIDRMGAQYNDLIESMRDTLTPRIAVLSKVRDIGTLLARSESRVIEDPTVRDELVSLLADNSEQFMRACVLGDVGEDACQNELIRQTRSALIYPVFFGSAITGVGVEELTRGITALLATSETEMEGSLKGRVFKIERGSSNEKIVYVRIHDGVIHKRDRVSIWQRLDDGSTSCVEERVTAVRVFGKGASTLDAPATKGSIAKLWGLSEVRVGDDLGSFYGDELAALFAPPTLESIVTPERFEQKGELFAAIQRLAEQDPLIRARRDDRAGSISLKLYGEVQKEVIGATLLDTFGVKAEFSDTQTLYVERPIGTGVALQAFLPSGPNFFWATVGLKVEPTPIGVGVTYDVGRLRGMIPLSFHAALEESVRETLRSGIYGWEIIDCAVTLTAARFQPPLCSAAHFRHLAAMLLGEALLEAKTKVCEPFHRFELEMPTSVLTSAVTALVKQRASITDLSSNWQTSQIVGTIPAGRLHAIARQIPELTHGEGTFVTEFDGYVPVTGIFPRRERTGPNPYDRNEYMLHVLRTMS